MLKLLLCVVTNTNITGNVNNQYSQVIDDSFMRLDEVWGENVPKSENFVSQRSAKRGLAGQDFVQFLGCVLELILNVFITNRSGLCQLYVFPKNVQHSVAGRALTKKLVSYITSTASVAEASFTVKAGVSLKCDEPFCFVTRLRWSQGTAAANAVLVCI